MVVGEIPNGLSLVKQFYATLHQRIFEFVDLLEEPVGQRLVGVIPSPCAQSCIIPKTIKLEPHLGSKELENRYREARDSVARSHYQIVWLLSEGKTTR